jgi:hypothetical protein
MKQKKSWEITEAFWEKAAPLPPGKERDPGKQYRRKTLGAIFSCPAYRHLCGSFFVFFVPRHGGGEVHL